MQPKLTSRTLQCLAQSGLTSDSPPPDAATWQQFLTRLDWYPGQPDSKTPPDTPSLEFHQQQYVLAERNKLRAILSKIQDGLCVFGREGQLLFLNPAARRYLDIEETLPQNLQILSRLRIHDPWHHDNYLDAEALVQLLREGGVVEDTDAQLLPLNENEETPPLPISCHMIPISQGAHITSTLLTFQDISEYQQVSAAMIAAKDNAEQASVAKSDFLSSMSHELRTPMNAILGYGELLNEDLEDAPEACDPDYLEDLQAYTGNILTAGTNLLQLINEVLDLTRIESGQIRLNITKSDLLDSLHHCVQQTQATLAEKNLSLHLEHLPAAEHPPIQVLADEKRLQQVIYQLLSNAVKHNREQGEISLHIEQSSPERVRLLIKDTGVGMNEEEQVQVFKPFTRISGRNLSRGTGIGLTIVHQLVEAMDGRIGVDSTPDVGSCFWIELPTGESPPVSQDVSTSTDRKYLLLYIEDSRTNVSLMSKFLEERPDIAFISAPTGEMGVELARAHHPDVILLDINLPGINGFEVLKQLRLLPATRHIPVLGLSADDTQESLDMAKTAGFVQYMLKPLQKKQLLHALSEQIG
ncbi:ATP-binding protein [Candidatus Venteria ishoeyi]|uniref:PAS domain-containing hybrid sensor histidine kinase/response regulator n=1 Tax=Candidatus Venteria ishoeyi TaxID=1899563 RepID=UPI0025A666B9|nr:PAS domain-containing hybrid sensor histidine kinase/response regulator [Candidatus Venteria ishoeyi]MDM8547782.1 ATP-binding protein [Candidatus Venteria ishoeyi]